MFMFPKETILSGASKVCDCGIEFTWGVFKSVAGYFVGTYCANNSCEHVSQPNTRETEYFADPRPAMEALNVYHATGVLPGARGRRLQVIEGGETK